MNLPNKLTIFRVILIVPFVILLLGGYAQWGWFQTVFGGIADITDYIALAISKCFTIKQLFGDAGA